MRTTWTFHSAGQIVFGPGAIGQLGELVKRISAGRVLIVTDPILVRAGLIHEVTRPLEAAGIDFQVYADGEPEPALRVAENCIAAARKYNPAVLVALGGGSNMDLAKITAAVLAHGGSASDYFGEDKIPGPVTPLVCVPTTAGTGSEVSGSAVLTDETNHVKVGIMSNYLRPRIALVDPKLTLSCPAKVTADSGIDALTHAIEAYTAVDNADFPLPAGEKTIYQGRHPLGDSLAERAISLIGANLARAVEHPGDLAAREAMSLGAMLAGLAFSNVGVALVHALEYPIGAVTHCSHGSGNGLLLPHVMRFNLPLRRQAFARIAKLLGQETAGLDEQAAAERAISAVEALSSSIGILSRLRELGARREQIPAFAEKALAIKRILRVNPRPVTLNDLIAILEAAY